jgi:DNA-binding transcriptional LysR family regulator
MRGELEFRHLRTFVVVAEELHFTRAAQRLHITQQSLSAQIQHIEVVLGARLLSRTTRKVELTDAGKRLLQHARSLIGAAERAWEDVQSVEAGQIGRVTISLPPSARADVHRLRAEIRTRSPGLKVLAIEALPDATGIGEQVDVAITRETLEEPRDVEVRPLRDSKLGVVIAANHELARNERIRLEQLAIDPLTFPPRALSSAFYDAVVSALRARGWSGPVEEFENVGHDLLIDAPEACARIASGEVFGVGFEGQYPVLPEGLTWRPIDPPLRAPLWIYWRRGAGSTVRRAVDIALQLAHDEQWLPRDGLSPGTDELPA